MNAGAGTIAAIAIIAGNCWLMGVMWREGAAARETRGGEPSKSTDSGSSHKEAIARSHEKAF